MKYTSIASIALLLTFLGNISIAEEAMQTSKVMLNPEDRNILGETKDIRTIFMQEEHLSDNIQSNMIHIYRCFDENGTDINTAHCATVKAALMELDKIRPRKNKKSHINSTQPQLKIIKKNALYQSEWLKAPGDELLNLPLDAGDIVYISCFD